MTPVLESLLPLTADSPEPLRDVDCRVVESLRPLRDDSIELRRRSDDGMITELWSLFLQILAMSDFMSAMVLPDSRRDLVDADFTPESADDSRRLRYCELASDGFAQGSDRARSASVSRRTSGCLLPRAFAVEPPHSRNMSVSWASELRRRRADTGGDVSCISVGGEILVICADESLLPAPSRDLSVDSSTCSRTKSSHPLPPIHTKPT